LLNRLSELAHALDLIGILIAAVVVPAFIAYGIIRAFADPGFPRFKMMRLMRWTYWFIAVAVLLRLIGRILASVAWAQLAGWLLGAAGSH